MIFSEQRLAFVPGKPVSIFPDQALILTMLPLVASQHCHRLMRCSDGRNGDPLALTSSSRPRIMAK
jgi:hypothetical protein